MTTWRQTSDKPLSESMMAYSTDTDVRHSVSVSYHIVDKVKS